jgi:hypothetical protein
MMRTIQAGVNMNDETLVVWPLPCLLGTLLRMYLRSYDSVYIQSLFQGFL